ncbi:hypothetical protein [Nakamurella leprariae]|uniref:Uncharacterized protein n=1 Tax=Nakamurella leprariae TaxID=2803911 RepID=A0A939BUT4_9ACTN|nr:hypothetical protein [Nakamurella leprariae]MBM9465848.1 hypothetical protein [Nakamurella leprariae]
MIDRFGDHWRAVPRVAKVSWASLVVLLVLSLVIGAVAFPDGGRGFAFALVPVGLDLVLVGVLTLTNHRGTANALLGMQRAVARRVPSLLPPSRGLNAVIATLFVVLGLVIAIGGPILT